MHENDSPGTADITLPDGSIPTQHSDSATSTQATTSAANTTQTDHDCQCALRHDDNSEDVRTDPLSDSLTETLDYVVAGLDDALTRTAVPVGPSSHGTPPTVPGYDGFSPLGEGGMGVVWKARQVALNRLVALKMVLGDQRAGSKELIRFLAEAEAVAAVKHPHVVQVYEYGDAGGRPFLAMEYLPGGSLTDRLGRMGRLDAKSAAELVGTLASAVQAAHDQGIVHRDLKPGNVLYDEQDRPRVTDFGLAKRSGGDLTATRAVMGTPAYMAPEQARGDTKFVGPQADVYSLGVILYECLTGTRPFTDPDQFALLRKVVEEEPERPRMRVTELPRDVELICLKCLAKDPAERYSSAQALATDLARFAAGEPVSVRSAGMVERAAKWARRKPTLAAAYTLGLLAVLLAGLGSIAAWQWRTAEGARDLAEVALRQADRARVAEAGARSEAVRQRERFERFEYGRTMQVAHQEWREGNAAAALALLDRTRPDLRNWEWFYVHRLCHSDLLTIKEGDAADVTAVSFSPDGSRIVTGGGDQTARVWDVRSGTLIFTMKGHAAGVTSASFSPDGTRIVTSSLDTTARLWDAKRGVQLLILRQPNPNQVTSASFSPDGSRIVTGGGDGLASVWDAKTGAKVLTLVDFSGRVTSVSFSPDGRRIVTGAYKKMVTIWDAKTGDRLLILKGHSGPVFSVAFSPDGSRILTASEDRTVKLWDAESGAERLTLRGHTNQVASASFSPDGSRLLSGSYDGTAKVWDARDGTEVRTLKGHTAGVVSASFSPDGSRIVTGSHDKTARIWDLGVRTEFTALKGHTGEVNSASFNPDGSRVVTGSEDGTARVWDVEGRIGVIALKGHTAGVVSASFSPDGSRIVTGGGDQTARVWDAKTGAKLLRLEGHNGLVYAASFDPSGSRILTGGWDQTVKVWDVQTGTAVITLTGHAGEVASASFSSDASWIVTGSLDGTARVWDAVRAREILVIRNVYEVPCAALSPDGSQIVTGSWKPPAKVWDAKSGAEIFTLKGHTTSINSASFSPDGSRIVTGGADYTVRIWDARSGTEVLTLKGHNGPVTSASFSPDGSRIVTGSHDKTARIWDATPLNREFLTGRPAPPQRAVK